MRPSTYLPGDVELMSAVITSNAGSKVNIKNLLISISIYEDIDEPYLYSEFNILDAIDLVKDLPIIGNETIELSFKTPMRLVTSKYKFKIYAVDSSQVMPSNKASTYVLKGVSEEYFTNANLRVESSYKDSITNIVNDILANQLKTKKPYAIEETRGLSTTIISRMTPFVAIDMLKQKAINKESFGGIFRFFENQNGFHFKSIDKLIDEGLQTINSKIFTHDIGVQKDKTTETYAFRNLVRLEFIKKADNLASITGGALSNSVKSFDMVTKKTDKVDFKLKDSGEKIKTGQTGKSAVPYDVATLIDNSNTKHTMFVPTDTSKGSDYINQLQGYKRSLEIIFNTIIVRGMCYGDNILVAGDLITLNIPDTTSIDQGKNNLDKRYSGNYVVTKLRHLITLENNKFRYFNTFDCNKIGING